MAENTHVGHRQRIRHRVRTEGLDNFLDYQVLEYALSFVIPYKDVNPLAHALIDKFGSFAGVLEADEEDLIKVQGLGEVSANFLTSIRKIYSYYEKSKLKDIAYLNNPVETLTFARNLFKGKLHEELYAICLTPNNQIVKVQMISSGTVSSANVNMRIITDLVSRNKVTNLIVAHNHPRGDANPSQEDNRFTKALVTTMAINNCHLLDHIIIGEEDNYSYRLTAKIDEFKDEIKELFDLKVSASMAKYGEVPHDKK